MPDIGLGRCPQCFRVSVSGVIKERPVNAVLYSALFHCRSTLDVLDSAHVYILRAMTPFTLRGMSVHMR